MIIENFEEKGLFEHKLVLGTDPNLIDTGDLTRFTDFYITKDMQFFVRPSIWNPEKWVIIPSTPRIAMKINLERFEGNEEEVLNKLKEWT